MEYGKKKAEAEKLGIVPGATVSLKSGGPKMTVDWIDDGKPVEGVISFRSDGNVYAKWFNGKKLEGAEFPYTSLKVVAGGDSST